MDETISPSPALRPRLTASLLRNYHNVLDELHAYRHELVIFVLISAVAFIFLLPFTYHTIPAGHVGVLWKRFGGGTVVDEVYPEGFRMTFPWDKLYIYDARLQTMQKDVQVMTSDGLLVTLKLLWRYHLKAESVGHLHKFAGPNYAATLLEPTISARTRDIIGLYKPEELYTEKRFEIEDQIRTTVTDDVDKSFEYPGKRFSWLVVEDVLIKSIILPVGVRDAIVRKDAMYHQMQEYTFRIQKEEKEAERKRIEALGIRNFQDIVSNGMSDSYLRWRGIEATLELAKSPNAKVVVIGNAKNGLPLILNMDSKEGGPSEDTRTPAHKISPRQPSAGVVKPSSGNSTTPKAHTAQTE